ncbi:FG-GAP-like repeat-containing protein [Sanyastnella coralliicola]|uniref:FG-GAP-like repeat-containing protein n=1 Tax=Sanyastnella coralliicola TaxID=3069118 RepID=UPI0027B976B6|nr:FG-GAP-like repeat-containing protein [Longitalea sp. SCSIO 12813]
MKQFYLLLAAFLAVPTMALSQSFADMGEELPNEYHSGGTVGVVDMNNDGYDDIVTLDNANTLIVLYQGADGWTEVNYGQISGSNQWGFSVGDMNNDGHNDVISGGAYDGVHFISIDEQGVSEQFDLQNGSMFMQDCNMHDIDNDGYLDFFGCHDDATSRMWRNNGSGAMVPNEFMIDFESYDFSDYPDTDHSGNYGSVWCDVDDDGDNDLFIAKCRQFVSDPMDPRRINQLWINDGEGNFTEEAEAHGLVFYEQSWTADFADYDNDGDFDALITNHSANMMLFENDGSGNFTDVSEAAGVDVNGFFLQAKMIDFDNDGYNDIVYAGGVHSYFHNNGDGTFTEEPNKFPYNDTMHSFGIGDLNRDGFVDLYASYGNIYVDADGNNPDRVWMNETNDNNWVVFDLEGIISNQNAVGAKVKIYGDFGVQVREVRAGESYGIVNTFQLHFGLGDVTEIDEVVIEWPSGMETVITDPEINTFHTIFESECQLANVDIIANGPLEICPGESVNIEAPMGYTYLWSNGETGMSIDAAATGNYSVTVFDENGCPGASNIVQVVVVQPELPSVTVNGDTQFCEGGSVELISSNADSYEWSEGTESQVLTVTESGTYYVTVPGVCADDLESEEITVVVLDAPDTPSVPDESIENPGTATLNGTGNELHWYENEMDADPIFVGNTFETPFLNSTTSFWVEDVNTYGGVQGNGGKENNDEVNGQYHFNSNFWLVFDANEDIILDNVKVYAGNEGMRSIAVIDNNGTIVAQGDFNVPQGESVVELGFFVPAGTGYGLRSLDDDPQLWREDDNSEQAYPYDLGGLATIVSSSVGGAGATEYYYFFYDWNVSTPSWECVSDRIEVIVTVVGIEEIEALASLNVFPNPASDMVTVAYELTAQKDVELRITDLAGRTIVNKQLLSAVGANQEVVNLSEFATGVYELQLVIDGQTAAYKLIIE